MTIADIIGTLGRAYLNGETKWFVYSPIDLGVSWAVVHSTNPSDVVREWVDITFFNNGQTALSVSAYILDGVLHVDREVQYPFVEIPVGIVGKFLEQLGPQRRSVIAENILG